MVRSRIMVKNLYLSFHMVDWKKTSLIEYKISAEIKYTSTIYFVPFVFPDDSGRRHDPNKRVRGSIWSRHWGSVSGLTNRYYVQCHRDKYVKSELLFLFLHVHTSGFGDRLDRGVRRSLVTAEEACGQAAQGGVGRQVEIFYQLDILGEDTQ